MTKSISTNWAFTYRQDCRDQAKMALEKAKRIEKEKNKQN